MSKIKIGGKNDEFKAVPKILNMNVFTSASLSVMLPSVSKREKTNLIISSSRFERIYSTSIGKGKQAESFFMNQSVSQFLE
jgi:hypothetical protein